MTKEALKLALEALESSRVFVTTREKIKHPEGAEWYDQIITAIKEALANEALEKMAENARELGLDYEQAQRTWVEIDDEDYIKAYELCDFDKVAAFEFFEDKLRSKNNG
jgi:hypothetical protein